jgi:hypothetical protein
MHERPTNEPMKNGTAADNSPPADEKAWNRALVAVGILLIPSVMCYCYLVATAVGWSSRPVPESWQLPQYLTTVLAFFLPWLYWILFATIRGRAWARWPLLFVGVLSLFWLPFLIIADTLGA